MEKANKLIRDQSNSYLRNQDIDITFTQWLCLDQINKTPGIHQKLLAQKLYKEEASISRILKRLDAKNLITFKKSTKDNKSIKLYLSPDGFEIFNKSTAGITRLRKKLFSNIHPREMNLIIDILKRIDD